MELNHCYYIYLYFMYCQRTQCPHVGPARIRTAQSRIERNNNEVTAAPHLKKRLTYFELVINVKNIIRYDYLYVLLLVT